MTSELTLQTLLAEGYEIKAAATIEAGPIHLFLQKGTRAYWVEQLGQTGEPPHFLGRERVRALHKE